MLNNLALIIPTYNPNNSIFKLISDLISNKSINDLIDNKKLFIVIVNDCSNITENIESIKKFSFIHIVNNNNNLGQGGSIKKGLIYSIKKFGIIDAVTCDDDMQHHPYDIQKLIFYEFKKSEKLLIGQRFNDKVKIPIKSKIGNYFSSKLIKLLFKINISDTQSGLRKYKFDILSDLISIRNNRFDFNIIVLLVTSKYKNAISKIDIKTIYFNKNTLSKFKPIHDSYIVIIAILVYKLRNFLNSNKNT
jgi:hypothetical protein